MNRIRIAFVTALLLGAAAFAYSQEPEAEHKPPKQEEPRRNPDAAPPRQEEPKAQKPEKQENPNLPKESKESKESSKPAHEGKGQPAQAGHARPAGKSAHIPDQKFKASFGRQHSFTVNRVINQTTIVPGQTQFVYTGYTFIVLDPWPAEWVFTDDCYIDYVDNEYFIFDVFHPGIRVALFVVG
jgi:type IV secretory pathway VirB10-like protein